MARWHKTKVRRLIVEGLNPVLSPAGFRFKQKPEAFVRKIEGGRQAFVLAIADYNPAFDIAFSPSVRLEAVQAIVNQFLGVFPCHYGLTLTAVAGLELLGWPKDQYSACEHRVTSESELAATLDAIRPLVSERVVPFFDEYRDVAALNRWLNPPGAENQLQPVHHRVEFSAMPLPYRAFNALTVAFLARDARFPELVRAYRSQVRALSLAEFPPMYERLVAFLLGETSPAEPGAGAIRRDDGICNDLRKES